MNLLNCPQLQWEQIRSYQQHLKRINDIEKGSKNKIKKLRKEIKDKRIIQENRLRNRRVKEDLSNKIIKNENFRIGKNLTSYNKIKIQQKVMHIPSKYIVSYKQTLRKINEQNLQLGQRINQMKPNVTKYFFHTHNYDFFKNSKSEDKIKKKYQLKLKCNRSQSAFNQLKSKEDLKKKKKFLVKGAGKRYLIFYPKKLIFLKYIPEKDPYNLFCLQVKFKDKSKTSPLMSMEQLVESELKFKFKKNDLNEQQPLQISVKFNKNGNQLTLGYFEINLHVLLDRDYFEEQKKFELFKYTGNAAGEFECLIKYINKCYKYQYNQI